MSFKKGGIVMRDFIIWIAVFMLAGVFSTALPAQEPTEDQEAVSALAPQWADAWNRGDAKAIGDMYTEDADLIEMSGQSVKGREAIEAAFADMMSTMFEGSKISIQMTATRFIKPDLVVGDSNWEITGLPEAEGEAPPSKGTSTIVAVKQDGQWLITTHRSRIPVAAPGTDQ
jgi:uncharacterized protein (TIGR02246 family)